MIDLLAAGQKRQLVIPPLQPITVPAPTVRVALAVYTAAEAAEDGTPPAKEADVLRRACAEWLPLRAFSVLWSAAFTPRRRLQALGALIHVEHEGKEADADASTPHWEALVARYRAAYRCSVDEVLSETWGHFVSQLKQVGHLQAQEQVRFIRAYTAIRSSDGESILEEILEAADPSSKDSESDDLSAEEREVRRRRRDELVAESYMKRQHMLN